MDLDEADLGPRSPLVVTPVRPPGSVRRTSSIDTSRPEPPDVVRTVDARARDVSTGADGQVDAVDTVQVLARVHAPTYELLSLTSDPTDPRLDGLIGATVAGGFRRRLAQTLDAPADRTSLAHLLLDDLPGAQLVAGYDVVHQREAAERRSEQRSERPSPRPSEQIAVVDIRSRIDYCAGWVNDGVLIEGLRRTQEVPVATGPPAPHLESPDDPEGWHPLAPLGLGGMRRRRRLDVLPATDGVHRFEAHFRDSHVSDAGDETIVHEYLVTGSVDARSRTLVAIDAQALVLPYVECPNALGSAQRVVGWSLDELRKTVHRELVGTSSCTHLNDTLRSLCDLDVLVDRVSDRPVGPSPG
ncbi:MAG: DUF2889 domain-containing protein [Acidimicrobiales bacterium]